MSGIGNADKSLADALKVWIIGKNGVAVVGAIGEGSSMSLTANWVSPFESDSMGDSSGMVKAAGQASTGLTAKSILASTQVWQGNQPINLPLTISFYTLYDAAKEVMEPIKTLYGLASPDTAKLKPVGRIPDEVTINVGRKIIMEGCIVASVESPLDGPRDKGGNLMVADVTLQIETKTMLSRSMVSGAFK